MQKRQQQRELLVLALAGCDRRAEERRRCLSVPIPRGRLLDRRADKVLLPRRITLVSLAAARITALPIAVPDGKRRVDRGGKNPRRAKPEQG